ncbi:hypothetical protein PanWU01x14_031290 [Parasponia andersonii]|uniref:Uncharacterized protein n=1 Tax=Parasponia andersonii TaxID=3476 RepID=A0A2P5DU70_PARAD|nr:hypothetical protein PanWU01x14_031290 [Parasponia andersonii]
MGFTRRMGFARPSFVPTLAVDEMRPGLELGNQNSKLVGSSGLDCKVGLHVSLSASKAPTTSSVMVYGGFNGVMFVDNALVLVATAAAAYTDSTF